MTYAEIHLNNNPLRAVSFPATAVTIWDALLPGSKTTSYTGPSTAHSDRLANVTQDPAGAPSGWYVYIVDGTFKGKWVRLVDITLADDTVPQPDCSAAVASAVAPLQAQITGLKTQLNDVNAQIGALNQQVTALKADIAKKDAYVAAFPKG